MEKKIKGKKSPTTQAKVKKELKRALTPNSLGRQHLLKTTTKKKIFAV